jgi:hypothetical protein
MERRWSSRRRGPWSLADWPAKPGRKERGRRVIRRRGRDVFRGWLERIAGWRVYPTMSRSSLALWGGIAAALGGVLFAAWGYTDMEDAPVYFTFISETLGVIVPLLFLVGLAGLYAQCKRRAGPLGRTGFVLGAAGSAIGVVPGFVNAIEWYAWLAVPEQKVLLVPTFYWLIPLFCGLMLIGVATIQEKRRRGWGALSLAMGLLGLIYYLTEFGGIVQMRPAHIVFGVLFSLSWMVLGYALLSSRVRGEAGV